MNEPKTLAIDDLYCAAFTATRTRLLATEQKGNRTNFVFSDEAGRATGAALDFVNGPTVNLREYLAAFKELRSVAYAARGVSRLTESK